MTEEEIQKESLRLMKILRYARTTHLARLILETDTASTKTRVGKSLNKLAELGEIDKIERSTREGGNIYRLKGLKGDGAEHTLAVTDVLTDILEAYPKSKIKREYQLTSLSRADAVMILRSPTKGSLPVILEVPLSESKETLLDKIKDYRTLESFFEFDHFGILVIGEMEIDQQGVICAPKFIKELVDDF
jgi:predicted transcriptional regulator